MCCPAANWRFLDVPVAMSIPQHQQTGETAETVAMLAFQRWGWNVGRDRVDEGYDLVVTPDRNRYNGQRFLVQVKGTVKSDARAAAYASVERSRMRQYAADPLPVFILRVLPDDTIFWIHAQDWALRHPDRIEGRGRVQVPFDSTRCLSDRDAFEGYLLEVLEPYLAADRSQASVRAEARFLNSLDPRLGVRLTVSEHGKVHEVFARDENVTTSVKFTPEHSADNLDALRQTLEYGLPAKVNVRDLRLVGSPLLTHIHPAGLSTGQLTISPLAVCRGHVRLFAGPVASPRHSVLTLPADLTRGTRGAAISNAAFDDVLGVELRFLVEDNEPTVRFQATIRTDRLTGPVQDMVLLDAFAPWAEQAIANGRVTMQLRFEGATASLTLDDGAMEALGDILHWMREVGRLHRVSRAMDSDVVFSASASWTADEARDLALVYRLLRGERLPISLDAFEVESAPALQRGSHGLFRLTSTLDVAFLRQSLGAIPVVIDLLNWAVEPGTAPASCRVAPGEGATAHITHWEPDCGLPMPDS